MAVDWFTVAAQAINFLILVWLLKRFLYQPILNAIDAREKRIADELADADAKKADAQQERDDFRRRNEEFDQHRDDLFQQAANEAKTERHRLLDEARNAATAFSTRRQAALQNEEQHLQQELIRRTQQEVFEIARKALSDLADANLEERIVEVFVRRLTSLNGKEKDRLTSSVAASKTPVIIRTAFDLPEALRDSARDAIIKLVGPAREIRFESSLNVIGGIELTADGQKISWSLADYLASLEKSVTEVLQESRELETPVPAESVDEALPQDIAQ